MALNQRRGRQSKPEGTVRVGTIMAIPETLRRFGIPPEAVLSQLGLSLDLFSDSDNLIGNEARGRLLQLSAEMTACPHFAFLVGQKIGLHSLGLIGLLAKSSPDVASAINKLTNLFFLQSRGAIVDLESDAHVAVISYRSYDYKVAGMEQIGDGAVAGLFCFVRELCGPLWLPKEASFAHRKPQDTKPYRDFLQTRLRFNAEEYSLVFDAAWLRQPMPSADPNMLKVLQHETQRLTAEYHDDFPERVRQILRRSILAGHYKTGEIAVLFDMHPRTLDRHLRRFEINFEEILRQVRFEIARQLLEDTELSVGAIALSLGYSRASTFIRAFRQWSGKTPGKWRTRL